MDCVFLKSLNPAQLQAVQHPPDIPLQILAGPGSGKTKVLTSRIAYLILHHKLSPSSICAVTFTNKAASEMRERLIKLIGKEKTAEVKMGTFHALCALYLRIYSLNVGLRANFTVCDAEESKKIISKLLVAYNETLSTKNIVLTEGMVLSLISKAKAKGHSPDDLAKQNASGVVGAVSKLTDIDIAVAAVYKEYEKYLRRNNSLDFDDLLLYGAKLFSQHQRAVQWCRHMLVDEFQDTNVMQYELMRYIAAANRCVTIVGDPDQSIYGWRSAEVANLSKMRKDFKKTEQILLVQNYRSTGSILSVSLAIVSRDKSRIPKTLEASHPKGPLPVLCSFGSEHEEAAFIAIEIKRLVATMGGMLGWGDFVVLLRFNALSRIMEGALQKEGIPNRVLAGHRFFERLEVKDLLAYLHIVDNPQFAPAFSRAINVPSRGIGEKTLGEILSRAQKTEVSPVEAVEQIYDSKRPDIKPPIKKKIDSFVNTVRELRRLANENTSPADLIRRLVTLTSYEDHLKKTQSDWESRWENVQELINFASEVQTDMNDPSLTSEFRDPVEMDVEVLEPPNVGEPPTGKSTESEAKSTPLRLFLQTSMLSSEGDTDANDRDKEKVTISTCHAAKGLEWPVTMIPAVERGTFPFYRTEDIEEERRLLYVACTRAQGLLYLSHSIKRKIGGFTKTRQLSEFVSAVIEDDQTLFADKVLQFAYADRAVIARVLNRAEPQKAEVARRLGEFMRTTRHRPSQSTTLVHSVAPLQEGAGSVQRSSTLPEVQKVLSQGVGPRAKLAVSSEAPIPTSAFVPRLDAEMRPPSPPSSLPSTSLPPTKPVSTQTTAANSVGSRKRLGMGRAAIGYPNKKFKLPSS